MRRSASEKMFIIETVEKSQIGVRRTLQELHVSKTNFYRWFAAYQKHGYEGLLPERARGINFGIRYQNRSDKK